MVGFLKRKGVFELFSDGKQQKTRQRAAFTALLALKPPL
jgi:hypothetical protein